MAVTAEGDSGAWLSVPEAAAVLGFTEGHTRYLVSHGHLASRLEGRRRLVSAAAVYQRLSEGETWVSWTEAADLAGCSDGNIAHAVRTGRIQRRTPANRSERSLLRSSVLEFAQQRAAELDERAQRHNEREERRRQGQAPADGHVWLSREQAAAVLGVSPNRVSQLVQDDLLPHVRRRHRVWFRRDLLEQVASARRLNGRRLSSTPGS